MRCTGEFEGLRGTTCGCPVLGADPKLETRVVAVEALNEVPHEGNLATRLLTLESAGDGAGSADRVGLAVKEAAFLQEAGSLGLVKHLTSTG